MSQLPRILRVGLAGTSIYVLSVIVRVSIAQWQTGDACPLVGPIPACYVVSISYAAMGMASLLWTKPLQWLFFAGATPVILLALAGTYFELLGSPTCPVSNAGSPMCFYSLAIGLSMLIVFLVVLKIEGRKPFN
jgi:hypothetical protein